MDGEEPPLIERLAAADVNYLQQVAQSYLEAAAADKIAAVTAALRTQVESGRRSYLTPFRYAQTLADVRNRLNEMRESRRDVVYEVASLLTALDVTDPNQVEALTPALRGVVLNCGTGTSPASPRRSTTPNGCPARPMYGSSAGSPTSGRSTRPRSRPRRSAAA